MSPADIEIHRKINLQDADVSDEHQKASKTCVMSLKTYFQ